MQRGERRWRRRLAGALGDVLRPAVDQLDQRLLARETGAHFVELLRRRVFARCA